MTFSGQKGLQQALRKALARSSDDLRLGYMTYGFNDSVDLRAECKKLEDDGWKVTRCASCGLNDEEYHQIHANKKWYTKKVPLEDLPAFKDLYFSPQGKFENFQEYTGWWHKTEGIKDVFDNAIECWSKSKVDSKTM